MIGGGGGTTCQILPTANIVKMGKIQLACCWIQIHSLASHYDTPVFTGRYISGLYNYANMLSFLSEEFFSVF